jgi:hypothetical protein
VLMVMLSSMPGVVAAAELFTPTEDPVSLPTSSRRRDACGARTPREPTRGSCEVSSMRLLVVLPRGVEVAAHDEPLTQQNWQS